MTSLFNIGVSGLKAQQAALSVVGQNITNASTPGYTRQRAEIESVVGSGQTAGAGARVASVTRIANAHIDEQVRADVSLFAELESFANRIQQIETGLFDGEFGIDAAMRDFFDAMQNAANEPGDLSMREFVLDNATALTNRFQGLTDRISLQALDLASSMESAAVRINEISGLLVDINDRIAGLQTTEGSPALNGMLDKREQLLKELAQYITVKTAEQSDGQLNVFVGKGQPLVLGQESAHVSISNAGDVVLRPAGGSNSQIITGSVQGGELGGLLHYKRTVLEPTQSQIGQIAAAFTVAFNQQHALGVDLEGNFGQPFFRDLNDPELIGARVGFLGGDEGNSGLGAVNVYIDDPFVADATSYELYFSESSPGSYEVRRRDDGEVVFRGSSFAIPQEISFQGVRVEFLSGQVSPGDEYLINPYGNVGAEFDVVLSDPAALALASPVATAVDPANTGNGSLVVNEILDAEHPLLQGEQRLMPPLLVEFVNERQYRVLDNSDPSRPQPLQPDLGLLELAPGGVNHLLPYELGTTVVSSSGPQVANLITASGFVADTTPLANGYPQGSLTVQSTDDSLNPQTVSFDANESARQVAAQISGMVGVTASARTELNLTNLVNDQVGTPLEIVINGEVMGGFGTLAELADQINANDALSVAGIEAVSDGTTLQLIATQGDDLALHFQGSPSESVTLTNTRGEQTLLRGSVIGSYSTATVGGEISVIAEPDRQITADYSGVFAVQPEHQRADLGFDVVLRGNVNAGDRFTLNFNSGGTGDNRNALALAGLGEAQLMGDPQRSFYGVFASLVQTVGVEAGKVNINKEAAGVLLAQSESFRESISGVNLDEEAALLIRHEQAYNAAAQIISVARDVFNVLLNSVS